MSPKNHTGRGKSSQQQSYKACTSSPVGRDSSVFYEPVTRHFERSACSDLCLHERHCAHVNETPGLFRKTMENSNTEFTPKLHFLI